MLSRQCQCWAVVPATGIGARMGADRPKQYLSLGEKTVLEHTLDNLLKYPAIDGVVLILRSTDTYWPELQYQSNKPLLTCVGGEHRYHSVLNGLRRLKSHLSSDCIVMIHDAVRPFVLHQDLDRLLQAALEGDDGALLALPVADTLKKANDDQRVEDTQAREKLWRALTPQAFYLNRIYAALESVMQSGKPITDDSSAMELAGYHPRLVSADHRNIKITHPQDLKVMESFLSTLAEHNRYPLEGGFKS